MMHLHLNKEECKQVVTSLTETIGSIEIALTTIRRDVSPGKYDHLTKQRAYLIALRHKFVPGMVDYLEEDATSDRGY